MYSLPLDPTGFDPRALGVRVAEGGNDWRAHWHAAADLGFLAMLMPEAFGGQNNSVADYLPSAIELGREVADNGLTMGLNSHVWTVQQPLVKFGTPAQQETYLPDLIAGRTIGAFALTEPDAGSDALNLETRARRQGDGYVLNGAKALIGMGPVCDVAIVFASTNPDHGSWGISAFLVEAGDDGFERGPASSKMGLNTLPLGPVQLRDCFVPESRRLGPEGAGARIFQAVLDWERAFILAPHVGAMERQITQSADYVQSRQVFGHPAGDFQSVSNRVADMRLRIETSRLMLAHAAGLYDQGAPLTQFAALTNLHISEAFLSSSLDAVRNAGGVGYLAGHPAGADLQDSVGGVIYSGTSDVQKQIIAKLEYQSRRQAQKKGTT